MSAADTPRSTVVETHTRHTPIAQLKEGDVIARGAGPDAVVVENLKLRRQFHSRTGAYLGHKYVLTTFDGWEYQTEIMYAINPDTFTITRHLGRA